MENITLEIDKVLYKDGRVPAHVKLERRIISAMFTAMEKAGFVVHSVESDDDLKVGSVKAAMEEIFNLDDCIVWFGKPGTNFKNWVRLIGGNGIDIISDWGVPRVPNGFCETLDAFVATTEDYE